MKKINFLAVPFLLIATVLAISCTKESSPVGTGYTPPITNVPPVSEIGSITDLGLINSETRVMVTYFNASSIALDGADVDVTDISVPVSFIYYVNSDAQIPEGEYFFSDADTKSPFTFDSALFGGAIDAIGNEIPSEGIVGGSVVVTQIGADYEFSFEVHLESGKILTGSAKGQLVYSDNEIYTPNNGNGTDNTGY